jgi:predicted ATP-dependent endonuclease of OLD family
VIRLDSVTVRGVPGLPDTTIMLQPVTALIGPQGAGKSRLLQALSWLLTGEPAVNGTTTEVRAQLVDTAGTRRIARGPDLLPTGPLPRVTWLPARDRVPATGDAIAAEALLEEVARRRMSGAEDELLLIEEPELMLTPQQQRHLYRLLRRYAERNQVIYSTRAPALLDAVYYHEIVRLDRTTSGTRIRRAPPELLSDEQRVRLAAEFDHERTEMFFATAVVLVEGQTERQSFPLIFERLGHDIDALGISIVEVGGKGNIALVTQILWELSIPHVLVFDSDRGRPAHLENNELHRLARGAPVFELEPDFEGAAHIHGYEDKVFDAWRKFHDIDAKNVPAIFKRIVDTAVELANGAEAPV